MMWNLQIMRRICVCNLSTSCSPFVLDETSRIHAALEGIESALFKCLDNFPHLSLKDNVKLREMVDLLMEILAAKGDAYLPGLVYLNTPHGIL